MAVSPPWAPLAAAGRAQGHLRVPVRLTILAACAALQRASLVAFAPSSGAVAAGRRRTLLHSGPNRERLKEEATALDGIFRSVSNFFNPEPPPPTKAEIEAAERLEEANVEVEKALRSLRLGVQTGTTDAGAPLRRAAPVAVLQSQAQQSLAIFASTREGALRDVLLSMRISAREVSERNILVVPVLFSSEERELLELPPQLKSSKLLNQAGVALPEGGGEDAGVWGGLFADEFAEAEAQGMGDQAAAQSLALLVDRTGKIVRRGVGRPDWQAIFADLGI